MPQFDLNILMTQNMNLFSFFLSYFFYVKIIFSFLLYYFKLPYKIIFFLFSYFLKDVLIYKEDFEDGLFHILLVFEEVDYILYLFDIENEHLYLV